MRGVGVVEDVDEYIPPRDGRVIGDDDDDDLPLWEGSSPGGIAPPEGKSAPTRFRFNMAALHPGSHLLIFFIG